MANDFIGNDELKARKVNDSLLRQIERTRSKEHREQERLQSRENKQAGQIAKSYQAFNAPRFSIGGFARSGYQNTGSRLSSSVKQAFSPNNNAPLRSGIRYSPHRGPSGLGQPVFTDENEHGYGSLRTNGLREYSER